MLSDVIVEGVRFAQRYLCFVKEAVFGHGVATTQYKMYEKAKQIWRIGVGGLRFIRKIMSRIFCSRLQTLEDVSLNSRDAAKFRKE